VYRPPVLSLQHESLRLLFHNRPELAPEFLRILGLTLPDYASVRTDSADFTSIIPAEYRSDLVVLLVDDKPVFAIVLEVQLGVDDDKLFSWPVYATTLRARYRCPATVLVVTPKPSVMQWASLPIPLGAGSTFIPVVLGPSAVPVITDPDKAIADPELAVLSVMAHGMGDPEIAARIGYAANVAVSQLSDRDKIVLYADIIFSSLSEAARKALQMIPQGYEFQSSIIRESIQKGEATGEARGEAKGQARGVLQVLEARGLPVSDAHRERILACADLEILAVWMRRSVTVTSADELFTQ
jgi:hypothetical protein